MFRTDQCIKPVALHPTEFVYLLKYSRTIPTFHYGEIIEILIYYECFFFLFSN